MDKFIPKVSIIIPVYNGSNYMREAIDSALNQTYKNIEIIVINDGSKDQGATESIALSYGDKIRYIYQENSGVGAALNKGISHMKGDYFSWLSHDDLYKPDKIEKQIELLKDYGQDVVVYSDYEHISAKGTFIQKFEIPEKGINNIKALIAIGGCAGINGCTLLIPQKAFLKYGLFNESLRLSQDCEMWFRIAEGFPFKHVKQSLVLSRQHDEQDTNNKRDLMSLEHDDVMNRYIPTLSDSEINGFTEKSNGSLYCLLDFYMKLRYKKIPIRLLEIIGKNANENTELFLNTLDKYIFKIDDPEKMRLYWKNVLQPILSQKKAKPLLLIYNEAWCIGGVPRLISLLMDGLTSEYDILLVTSDKKQLYDYPIPPGANFLRISPVEETDLPWRLAALSAILNTDLVIGQANYIGTFLPIYKILKELNIKSIASNNYHYYLPYILPYLNPLIIQRQQYLKYADASTWLTTFSTRVYGVLQANAAYVFPPATFNIADSPASFGKTIITVGRFDDIMKRMDLTLEVFGIVVKKHPDAKLIIVGHYDKGSVFPTKNNETLGQILERLKIEEANIEFTGASSNVEQYYSKASMFMMTSETEGMPLVLLEAAGFGLPSVIFEISGLEDIISNGKNGYVIEYGNVKVMAEKISLILSDEEKHAKMSKNALITAKKFTKENSIKRWKELIKMIIESSQGDIEEKLKTNFLPTVENKYEFSKKMVREYEKYIGIMQKNIKNQIPPAKDRNGTKDLKQTEKSQKACDNSLKRTNIFYLPLILTRDLFLSLRDDDLKTTWKKICNKLGFGG